MNEICDNISLSFKYPAICLTLFKPYENKECKKGIGVGCRS